MPASIFPSTLNDKVLLAVLFNTNIYTLNTCASTYSSTVDESQLIFALLNFVCFAYNLNHSNFLLSMVSVFQRIYFKFLQKILNMPETKIQTIKIKKIPEIHFTFLRPFSVSTYFVSLIGSKLKKPSHNML